MTRKKPSRGRRVERRKAEREQLAAQRGEPTALQVPDQIRQLTDDTEETPPWMNASPT